MEMRLRNRPEDAYKESPWPRTVVVFVEVVTSDVPLAFDTDEVLFDDAESVTLGFAEVVSLCTWLGKTEARRTSPR